MSNLSAPRFGNTANAAYQHQLKTNAAKNEKRHVEFAAQHIQKQTQDHVAFASAKTTQKLDVKA